MKFNDYKLSDDFANAVVKLDSTDLNPYNDTDKLYQIAKTVHQIIFNDRKLIKQLLNKDINTYHVIYDIVKKLIDNISLTDDKEDDCIGVSDLIYITFYPNDFQNN